MMGQQEEILVVDDTTANLKLLNQILSEQGYKVRISSNGNHALKSISLAQPDLVLLDIKMPGVDGYEVCKQIKANPQTMDIPVIFISALDDLRDKLSGFQTGGVDYISKPFHAEEVLARVKTHLLIRKTQQILQQNNERMQRELNLAWHLQINFIPQSLPQYEGWQFSAMLQPARETSGDFYDIFALPDGKLGIIIADVVDKGVAAALFMVLAWSLLREQVLHYPELPELVFQEVNQRILSILTDMQYVTVFLAILDPLTGRVCYANAGHNPPLWIQAVDQTIHELFRTGLPLGVSDEYGWTQSVLYVAQGDVLFLYTDGLTEACNSSGKFVGLDPLKKCLLTQNGCSADEIKTYMTDQLQSFLMEEMPQDDLTLLVVKRCMP